MGKKLNCKLWKNFSSEDKLEVYTQFFKIQIGQIQILTSQLIKSIYASSDFSRDQQQKRKIGCVLLKKIIVGMNNKTTL